MTTDYSSYTVAVSNDPIYYGTECTQADADRIASDLRKMIESEFAGVNVSTSAGRTTGPEQSVIDEIDAWVAANWTAVL